MVTNETYYKMLCEFFEKGSKHGLSPFEKRHYYFVFMMECHKQGIYLEYDVKGEMEEALLVIFNSALDYKKVYDEIYSVAWYGGHSTDMEGHRDSSEDEEAIFDFMWDLRDKYLFKRDPEPPVSAEEFEVAIKYAVDKHAGQTRKNGEPYVLHPIRVATYVRSKGGDLTCQTVALFHDLLEDTSATEEEISEYGEAVLEAVKLLSKNLNHDMDSYIENILKNPMARLVKEGDRIDNLTDAVTCGDVKFMKKYVAETEQYYLNNFPAVAPYLEALKNAITE
ncbi:MAG: HD domain-containing protein [Lachnospiraceae bacterium]|nr:HD domain-containing protein [Lachnospiraceae bacterium]